MRKPKTSKAMNKEYLSIVFTMFTLISSGLKWGIIGDGEWGLYDQVLIIEKRSTWMHEYEKIKVFLLPWSLLGKKTPPIKVFTSKLLSGNKQDEKRPKTTKSMPQWQLE